MPKQFDGQTRETTKAAYLSYIADGLTHKQAITATAQALQMPRRRIADWAKRFDWETEATAEIGETREAYIRRLAKTAKVSETMIKLSMRVQELQDAGELPADTIQRIKSGETTQRKVLNAYDKQKQEEHAAYTVKRNLCLGVDPGIAFTGWGSVQRQPVDFKMIDSGVISTETELPIGTRLEIHYNEFRKLLKAQEPTLVCIESVFFNRNIKSALSTAQVIGVIELACIQQKIQTLQVKPQAVKAAVTGRGTVGKEQVKRCVNKLLGTQLTSPHEADASAAAIAGLLHRNALR